MPIAEVLAAGVVRARLPRLIRATVARRRAAILLYHDPSPATVDAHLAYLRRYYTIVPLAQLVAALREGRFRELPPRTVAITIDDGHRGNFALLDVFRAHQVVPTIYLCSQIVATDRHYWFLDTPDPEPLKRVSNRRRLELLGHAGFDQAKAFPADQRQALSATEIHQMRDAIDFGGHTRFHPILPACDDAESHREIAGCRTEVAAIVEHPCEHFAYPNGDSSPRDREHVRRAGFLSGRSTRIGWVGPRTDPYQLPILGVPDDASTQRLAADLTGVTSWLAARSLTDKLLRFRGRSSTESSNRPGAAA